MDDLGANKARLMELAATAKPDDVLVDLGVRWGASSLAMLEATSDQQCRVFGIDPAGKPNELFPERYTFLMVDSITGFHSVPSTLFLVFFDTVHIAEQVIAELWHYWVKIRIGGWAIFHDTGWPENKKDHYLGRDWDRPEAGIMRFFANGWSHIRIEHHPEDWGMTMIQKRDAWVPQTVEGLDDALALSKMLTINRCGVG